MNIKGVTQKKYKHIDAVKLFSHSKHLWNILPCSQVIFIIWHAIYFLCVLEVTYRCQKIVDKEAIELEILDTVNKVQSDLNCVVF